MGISDKGEGPRSQLLCHCVHFLDTPATLRASDAFGKETQSWFQTINLAREIMILERHRSFCRAMTLTAIVHLLLSMVLCHVHAEAMLSDPYANNASSYDSLLSFLLKANAVPIEFQLEMQLFFFWFIIFDHNSFIIWLIYCLGSSVLKRKRRKPLKQPKRNRGINSLLAVYRTSVILNDELVSLSAIPSR